MNYHVIYLDENNLYGWAMSQKLPADSFKWKKSIMMKKVIMDIF